MLENNLTFDELSMLDAFKSTIENAFSTSSWYNLFGKKKPRIYYSLTEARQNTAFPCFVITMSSTPAQGLVNSSQVEQYSSVIITIEQFNQEVGTNGKERLGIMINHELKKVLQETYKVKIISNNELLNIDSTIYRRQIICSIIFDNKNQIIYQGDSYYGY